MIAVLLCKVFEPLAPAVCRWPQQQLLSRLLCSVPPVPAPLLCPSCPCSSARCWCCWEAESSEHKHSPASSQHTAGIRGRDLGQGRGHCRNSTCTNNPFGSCSSEMENTKLRVCDTSPAPPAALSSFPRPAQAPLAPGELGCSPLSLELLCVAMVSSVLM